jgi:hypothetical protein
MAYTLITLIVSICLALGVAWFFIRHRHTSVGILSGFGLIVFVTLISLVAITVQNKNCIAACQQQLRTLSDCQFGCGEGAGFAALAVLIGTLNSAVIFLITCFIVVRRGSWSSISLLSVGVTIIVLFIFEVYAVGFYAGIGGVVFGTIVCLSAVQRRARETAL